MLGWMLVTDVLSLHSLLLFRKKNILILFQRKKIITNDDRLVIFGRANPLLSHSLFGDFSVLFLSCRSSVQLPVSTNRGPKASGIVCLWPLCQYWAMHVDVYLSFSCLIILSQPI